MVKLLSNVKESETYKLVASGMIPWEMLCGSGLGNVWSVDWFGLNSPNTLLWFHYVDGIFFCKSNYLYDHSK